MFCGIDIGASFTKVVVINEKQKIIGKAINRTSIDLKKTIKNTIKEAKKGNEIKYTIATGFGRTNASAENISEISSQAKGCYFYFPKEITIVDIGGQDTKIIKLNKEGKRVFFQMNRKCSAGTGAFIEEISHKLNIPLNKFNSLAMKSKKEVKIGSYCTVFAGTEILTRIREGEKKEDLIKGAFVSVAKRVIEMLPSSENVVLTGGLIAYNKILAEILQREINKEIFVPKFPQFTCAFGASLFAWEKYKKF